MTYYSNWNQIRDLVKQIMDQKVHTLRDLDAIPDAKVDMYIFDNLFEPLGQIPDCLWSFELLMRRRPDWGGTILEMMKRNERVYLFCGEWCRVMYRSGSGQFKFIHCRDPALDAERSCLIATDHLSYMMSDAFRDLFEPLRFARDISQRVLESDKSPRVEEILTFNRCAHKETCLKLEELI